MNTKHFQKGKPFALTLFSFALALAVTAQVKPAAYGFDTLRANIAHGKMDSISLSLIHI